MFRGEKNADFSQFKRHKHEKFMFQIYYSNTYLLVINVKVVNHSNRIQFVLEIKYCS